MIDFDKRAGAIRREIIRVRNHEIGMDGEALIAAFGRECWNAAIEEAVGKITETGDPLVAADDIRSLKVQP